MVLSELCSCGPTSWLAGGVVVALLVYWLMKKDVSKLPPAPGLALPFIGHAHLLKQNPRNQLKEWAQKFGPAFRLQMGSQTVIVLNSLDALKEALVVQTDYFNDRASRDFITMHTPYKNKGIFFSSGDNWHEQRTTSLNLLRYFGMGKNSLAEKISDEISLFIKELSGKQGRPSDIRTLTSISVSNIMCSILFGNRYEFSDRKFMDVIAVVNDFIQTGPGIEKLNYFRFPQNLPFDVFKVDKRTAAFVALRKFTQGMIDRLREDYDPDNLDNYIVAYVEEMKSKQKSGQQTHLDEGNLSRGIDDLFVAGTKNISSTICWGLLYALHNPGTQDKIYKEIVEHVGTERMPNMTDKPKLKYLAAFTMEVQRIVSIVPFSVPHECNHDTTVAGYAVPRGAVIIPNLDAVLRSEKIWGDPDVFRPERFLDGKGNLVRRDELVHFSLGKRMCLGEAMVNMELFLFFSSLFQRFEFLPADSKSLPPIREVFGVVLSLPPFEIKCVERNR